jgi:hypothetical protein
VSTNQNETVACGTIPIPAESAKLDEVIRVVNQYYPGLVGPVLAELSVFGSMALANRTKPLSLIFEAGSGSGKTAVVQMVFPIDEGLKEFVYRSDKFTPKSFVSHAANIKEKELQQQDLLPKLKDKVLVTKELAPIFRGRKEELTDNFSVLISVLDGKGFTSDSGMRGQRGYQELIVFNWVGATTPIPKETHRLMSQLGTRLLFYDVPSIEPTEDELIAYAERDDSSEGEDECAKVVNEFLLEFFKDNSIGSVNPSDIIISKQLLGALVRWGTLLVKGRTEIRYEKEEDTNRWEPIAALASESPYRVLGYFKDMVRGHALIHGRKEVNESDMKMIAHVAISSIPGHLRPLIKELRKSDNVDTRICCAICKVSQPTARKYMKEISLLGFADLEKGNPQSNQPDLIRLHSSFDWLRIRP